MEHITVTDIGNGFVRLDPAEGYKLLDKRTNLTYSYAEVKRNQMHWFEAVQL